MRRIALLATSTACIGQQASIPGGEAPSRHTARASDSIAPVVDHHQHLVSQAGADWIYERGMPRVELPSFLDSLLRERASRWNDSVSLSRLYTDSSVAFYTAQLRGYSAAGRLPVGALMSGVFGRPFRMTPFAVRVADGRAFVAGFLTRGTGRAARHFGQFYIAAERSADNRWLIASENLSFPAAAEQPMIDGDQLVSLLDDAGINKAIVLSVAYWFDSRHQSAAPDAVAEMRAENDWTAREVAKHPHRLVGFCSFNPTGDHALSEVDRCASTGQFAGIKLHFGTSGVDLRNPEHLDRVRHVFRAANDRRLAIVVHVRGDRTYGGDHARLFLDELLPQAPDVVVQIAHLWGGEGYNASVLTAFTDAVASRHPATGKLYFDVSDAALVAEGDTAILQVLAARMRTIGLDRMLYGSDAVGLSHPSPREAWAAFRREMPLTETEFRIIAQNVAPYVR